jgi:15-cis-phytoene synthase
MIGLTSSDPDRLLASAYANAALRPVLVALWAFDEALGRSLAATREPMLAEIRLRWWREQVESIPNDVKNADSVIAGLKAELQGRCDFAALAEVTVGWAALLDPFPLSQAALELYATLRGGRLFGISAEAIGIAPPPTLQNAGEGWALADFACRCSDQETATLALSMAGDRLAGGAARDVPASLRPLGVLARLAQGDVIDGLPRKHAPGSPRRALRALRFALLRR